MLFSGLCKRKITKFTQKTIVPSENYLFYLVLNFFISTQVVSSFAVSVLSSSVWVLLLVFLYLYLSFRVQRYHMNLVRELSRLKAISTSPIIQKLKEGFEGVSSIRFYNKRERQFKHFFEKIDSSQKNAIAFYGAEHWFNVRVALLSMMVTIPIICLSVSFILIIFLIFRFFNFLAVCFECRSRDLRVDATLCSQDY